MNKNKPKYVLIAAHLLDKIKDGSYPLNSLIPRETDLAAKFKVSRPTIRQAIKQLEDKGYLERRRKKGTWVKAVKIEQEFTHVIESYSEEMNSKGVVPKTNVLLFTQTTPNDEIMTNLNLTSGEKVFKLVRLRYADQQPLVLVTSYIPVKICPDMAELDFTQVSLYSFLASKNYAVKHVKRKLEVQKADQTTANLLNIQLADPIFYFHTAGFTKTEVPVEYSIAQYRGDLNSFKIDLRQ